MKNDQNITISDYFSTEERQKLLTKTFIITGGAGFIGSNVIRELNQLGISNIIVVEKLDAMPEKISNLYGFGIKKIVDYKEVYYSNFAPIDCAIIHLGANSSTTTSDLTQLYNDNYINTIKWAKRATDNGIPFIYASSAATYGMGENGYVDRDDLDYLNMLKPLNPYAYFKKLVDIDFALQHNFDKYRSPFYGLKFFNVVGKGEFHKKGMESAVLRMFNSIRQNEQIKLFKSNNANYQDGCQVRDFVYATDVARAIISFALGKAPNGLYNIGSGVGTTWNDMAKLAQDTYGEHIGKVAACNYAVQYVDMPDSMKKQYQYKTVANMTKYNNLAPYYDLTIPQIRAPKEWVGEYVRWLSENT